MAQSTRGMVDKIDFVTSFGHREGGDHRERLGIATKGSTLLIKDLAIWRPDLVTKEFTVMSLHPGVTERMCRRLAVEGQFAENLDVTPAPSELELKTLRDLKARTDAAHKGESSIAAAPLPTTAQRRELSSRCAIEEVEGLTTLIIR
jgi:glutaconate CoA-transferase subunit B